MKKIITLFVAASLLLACSSDNDEFIKEISLTIKLSQNWDGTDFNKEDFAKTEYTNKLGTKLTIEKLRYLLSNITLTNAKGEKTILSKYNLFDVSNPESLSQTIEQKITEGAYNLSFTFGFSEEDNIDGIYKDLNNDWDVQQMHGGGYHFMQLEGKFLNKDIEQQGFAYHTIKAFNMQTRESIDTSFTVDLGTITLKNDATITIGMNIAEWFKNPNDWDLNELNSALMGNFDAQQQMSANGKSGVFKLINIAQ